MVLLLSWRAIPEWCVLCLIDGDDDGDDDEEEEEEEEEAEEELGAQVVCC